MGEAVAGIGVARIAPDGHVSVGERVQLTVRTDLLHLFDPATGMAIRALDPQPAPTHGRPTAVRQRSASSTRPGGPAPRGLSRRQRLGLYRVELLLADRASVEKLLGRLDLTRRPTLGSSLAYGLVELRVHGP